MNLDYVVENKQIQITLAGDYRNFDDTSAKSGIFAAMEKTPLKEIVFNGSRLGKWDSTLVVILFEISKIAVSKGIEVNADSLPDNLKCLIVLALKVNRRPSLPQNQKFSFLEAVGNRGLEIYAGILKGWMFMHQTLKSVGRFFTSQAIMRKVDFMFAMEECSYKAIGIVSLVSFMVGLILAFVGAIQLKTFGAQIYVASLVAIGMIRIMGAIMVGIIMAGRTGASYAATIGTMQVNEEIDALKTMGIPVTDFLVLPRILALVITMPFLTILADFMGILGGAAVGVFMLDIAPPEYWKYSLNALKMGNFLVGLFHGFVFGIIIALCGCYYGVNCGRNADSVGFATTRAVVSSIVWMIVMTGFITWGFEVMGI